MFIELWPLSTMSPSGATCPSCPAPTPKHLESRLLTLPLPFTRGKMKEPALSGSRTGEGLRLSLASMA